MTTISTQSDHEISVTTREIEGTMCFRADTTVPYAASNVHGIVRDMKQRQYWDPNCVQIKVYRKEVQVANNNNYMMNLTSYTFIVNITFSLKTM